MKGDIWFTNENRESPCRKKHGLTVTQCISSRNSNKFFTNLNVKKGTFIKKGTSYYPYLYGFIVSEVLQYMDVFLKNQH